MKSVLVLLLFFCGLPVAAQTSVLRGRVVDPAGLGIQGAVVRALSTTQQAVTNPHGDFQLTLPTGSFQLHVARVGYDPVQAVVAVPSTDTITFRLRISPVPLASLVVSGQRESAFLQTVTPETVRKIPPLGEADVFRAVAVLPFATQPNDLKGRIHFAGGASDETGVYLDGHPMQDPFHLMGLLGAINLAAIDHADVRMHHLPAWRDGALSGVIELETASSSTTPRYEAAIGLLSSSLTTARTVGPVDLLASGRITYLDRIARLFPDSTGLMSAIPLYGFTDAVLRAGWTKREWSTQLLVYTTRDYFRERELIDEPGYRPLTWGETLVGARVSRRTGASSLDFHASLDRATSELDERPTGREIVLDTRRDRVSAGAKYSLRIASSQLAGGAELDRFDHTYVWNARGRTDEIFTPRTPAAYSGAGKLDLFSIWGDANFDLSNNVRLSTGLRSTTSSGHWWVAPRAAVTYTAGAVRVTSAINRRLQFEAQLEEPPEGSIAPPVFLLESPRKVDVAALSFEWLDDLQVDRLPLFRIEAFVKRYSDRTYMADSAAFPSFERIRGSATGASASVRGSIFGGWLQGTYRYQRVREELDQRSIPTSWDAPHAVTAMFAVPVGDAWTLTAVYQAHSGRATTPVVARIFAPQEDAIGRGLTDRYLIGNRNSIRVPAYHRVDLGARRTWNRKNSRWSLSAQIINVLYRQNAIDYDWQQYYARLGLGRSDAGTSRSGLPIVPTVSLGIQW